MNNTPEHHTPTDHGPEHHRPLSGNDYRERSDLFAADLLRAEEQRADISHDVARQIASLIAPGRHSALAAFARGETVTNTDLREEYLPLLDDPDTPEDVRQWVHWIGAHLIHTENPQPLRHDRHLPVPDLEQILWHTHLVPPTDEDPDGVQGYVRGNATPREIAIASERLADLAAHFGKPFLAFLSLNDVDALAPNLEDSFSDCYIGFFTNQQDVMYAMTELKEVEDGIEALTIHPAGSSVHIDYGQIWENVNDTYTITETPDGYYVFQN